MSLWCRKCTMILFSIIIMNKPPLWNVTYKEKEKLLTLTCFCTSNIRNSSLCLVWLQTGSRDVKRIGTGWTARGKGVECSRGEREREQAPNWTDATIEPIVCACHATHFPPFTDLRAAVCIVMSEQPGTNVGGLVAFTRRWRPPGYKVWKLIQMVCSIETVRYEANIYNIHLTQKKCPTRTSANIVLPSSEHYRKQWHERRK